MNTQSITLSSWAKASSEAPAANKNTQDDGGTEPPATQYKISNAYGIKDDLKAAGAVWSAEHKAWVVSAALFEQLDARTHAYGMAWCKGWAKAIKEYCNE